VFYRTAHPYTRGLIAAMPKLDRIDEVLTPIEGTPPSIYARPSGCSFAPRCDMAQPECTKTDPALRQVGPTHTACLRAEEIAAKGQSSLHMVKA
jgi:oligopeptide/dipeptide ABC transporter ATP-binding protein